jgi:hypothetical protein
MYTKCQRKGAAALIGTNMQSVAKKVQGVAAMQHFVAEVCHNVARVLFRREIFD